MAAPPAVNILIDSDWVSGYLDATPQADDYVLAVTHWLTIGPVTGLFFQRRRSISLVRYYVRDVGLRPTVRRIRSRRAERVRNRRFVAFGLGQVIQSPPGHAPGDLVAFATSASPLCAERVVVPRRLVFKPPDARPQRHAGHLLYLRDEVPAPVEIYGWSPWSGVDLDDALVLRVGEACRSAVARAPWSSARQLPTDGQGPRTCVPARARARGQRPSAVLYGMGNYAKTTILPNLRATLDVRAIHEIDPLQIGPQIDRSHIAWSTDPEGDLGPYDAVLVAGYHHTHAGLAERALLLGKAVVVEKPLATSADQLSRLAEISEGSPGSLFACFQRRYTQLNDLAIEDLGTSEGDPIHYHCVIYEEPLPPRHWYRWPHSGSRLMSNGCHWVDHFLHLNSYSVPTHLAVETASEDVLNITARLRNGAVFTMVLTDVGSGRLGVRESIELRAGDVTVRMRDGRVYEAESTRRRLRHTTVSKSAAQQRMYASIGSRIGAGEKGEPMAHNLLSARTTVELDRRLEEIRMDGASPITV